MRDQTNGFLLATISPRRILSLKNKPLSNCITMSSEALEALEIIANQNETSVYRMMMRAVDTLIKIEFDRDAFIENSDIIRENILMYNKKIIGMAGTAYLHLNARGLKKGIQVLVFIREIWDSRIDGVFSPDCQIHSFISLRTNTANANSRKRHIRLQ